MGRGKALDTYRLEAAKCVLVCANCHGEIEAGLLASPPAGSTYDGLREGPPVVRQGEPPIEMAGT